MIELLLAELERAQKTYEPNAAVRARLREVTFVPIIGPFLTGKSTIRAAATRLDHEFGRVRSFTTRPRRADEVHDLDHGQIDPAALPVDEAGHPVGVRRFFGTWRR